MYLEPVLLHASHLGSRAMDNLRETIHENERLNGLASRVQTYIHAFFLSQETITETLCNT